LPGTTGWGASFGGAQTVLWNSQPKNPTIQTNGFAFSIVGSSNPVIVVEVSTNLTNPSWFPVATNSLVSGSSNFNDTSWTNRAVSFYRVRSQ